MTEDAITRDRRLAVVVATAFALALAFLPLADLLDEGMDRKRPLYEDVRRMDDLQYHQMKQTGEPLELTLREGETVEIGGRRFGPGRGITLTVSVDDSGYCIKGTNHHGDSTRHCNDGETDPVP